LAELGVLAVKNYGRPGWYNFPVSAAEALSGRSTLSHGRQVVADGALVAVTFIWGSTFVLVKDLVTEVPPMYLLTIRFAIGTLALTLMITAARRWTGFSLRELGWGVLIGLAVGFGYAFQTVGIQYTTASNAGFVTGLLVVIAPILGIFILRQMPSHWAIFGVILATAGLGMLSLHFDNGVQANWGDAIVLGGSLAFAFQVVLIAHATRRYDPIRLAMVQILVAGVVNALGSLLFEYTPTSVSMDVWAGAAFLGIMATAVAIGVQTSVQSNTTVIHASLIFVLEPVFAAIFGFLLQGDRLSLVALLGGVLIISGMLIAELGPYLRRRWRA
jgi:drug/metabolite transporter (DMT)-like permease